MVGEIIHFWSVHPTYRTVSKLVRDISKAEINLELYLNVYFGIRKYIAVYSKYFIIILFELSKCNISVCLSVMAFAKVISLYKMLIIVCAVGLPPNHVIYKPAKSRLFYFNICFY